MTDNINRILWTAKDFVLTQDLWKRLEDMGYKVLMTESDDSIINKIQETSPSLWVGQINGDSSSQFSRLSEIKSDYPDLPVILMSMKPSVEDAVQAIKLGASEYVTGSVSSDQLWGMIEGALTYPCPKIKTGLKVRKNSTTNNQPIASHPSMIKIFKLAKKIAPSRSTVLIKGETGVGKEVLARFIHNNSDRKSGPFIAVNCAALPETLLESELFGHEKGAFTGAVSRKKGKFELANEGTLLLDEISETETSIQAKLLRVLQEREIDRVGGQAAIPVDVRVIATTNRDLESEIKSGNFRQDLFYRLNVIPLTLPPLRQRADDILPLADHFLEKHCALNNIPLKKISTEAVEFLKKGNWSGNVREFENLMERATLLVDSEVINSDDLDLISSPEDQSTDMALEDVQSVSLREMERKMIFKALDDQNGNRTHAAKILGISVRTLRNKLNEYKNELEEEN